MTTETTATEEVVLLADDGTPLGTASKRRVHDHATALHLAFSCHVRNTAGDVLVTRRALGKATWPGVWTNSFCGHPRPGEEPADAVRRHARHELGLEIDELRLVLPHFRYRAVDASGVVENEICPVFTADAAAPPEANPDEVAEIAWVAPADLARAIDAAPWAFSPWLVLQRREMGLYDLPPEHLPA